MKNKWNPNLYDVDELLTKIELKYSTFHNIIFIGLLCEIIKFRPLFGTTWKYQVALIGKYDTLICLKVFFMLLHIRLEMAYQN